MVSVTSGDPEALGGFVTGAGHIRAGVAASAEALAAAYRGVVAGCERFVPQLGSLALLAGWLGELSAGESFATGVAQALAAADAWHGGVATVSDAAVATELASLGGVAPTGTLQVAASALLGDAPTSGFADDPVCTATGNFAHREIDLAFPGRAGPLCLTRWYNSMSQRTGAFGPGWSSLLDARLVVGGDTVLALLPDGAEIRFLRDAAGTWRGEARPRLHLRAVPAPGGPAGPGGPVGPGGFELLDGPASGYSFDASGALTRRWVGRSELAVTREGGAVVGLAEACSGRSVSLSWEAGRVVGARSPDGREVAYAYDGAHLVAVARPAGAMAYEIAAGKVVRITDADGVSLVANRYDDAGRVLAQQSPFGRVSHYAYGPGGVSVVSGDEGIRNAFVHDRRGNLVAMVDAAGRPMRMSYDAAGHLTGWRDRRGAAWSLTVDEASGRPRDRRGPGGLAESFAWDDQDRLVAHEAPWGTTRWEYQGEDRTPSRIVEPGGAATMIEVSPDDLAVAVTDADGVRATLTYDADGQVTSATDALGNVTRLTYDPAGRLAAWRMPSSITAEFRSDEAGRVLAVQRPGARQAYTWSPAGRAVAGVDPAEGAWSVAYGPHGALVSVTDAAGGQTSFSYDTAGNLVSVEGPDGRAYTQGFDPSGALVAATDPAGATWAYERDAEGDALAMVGPDGARRSRSLDALGRTVSETDATGRTWRRSYGEDGRLASIAGPDGEVTAYRYDPAGRLAGVGGPEPVSLTWSAAGRLLERRSASGAVQSYSYDAAGRLVGVADAEGSVSLVLDVDGRVIRASDERGRVVSVRRDPAGRAVAVVDRRGVVRHLGFAASGRPSVVGVGPGASSFAWDQRGLLAGAADALGAATSFGYDAAGRLSSVTDPLGGRSSLSYDAAGRLAAVAGAPGATTSLLRDVAGALVGVAYPDGSGWRLWRDPSGLVTGYGPLGAAEASVVLERDAAGRLAGAGRPRAVSGGAGAACRGGSSRPVELPVDEGGRVSASPAGELFAHDLAGQLVEWSAPGRATVRYRYDPGGRLVAEESGEDRITYTYDAVGALVRRVAADGTVTRFTYDAAGRRVREDSSAPGPGRSFAWDPAGRLVGVTAGGTTTTIACDTLGLPVSVGGVEVGWDTSSGWPQVCRIGEVAYERDGELLVAVGADGARSVVALDWAGNAEQPADPWGASSGAGVRLGFRGELCIGGLVWLRARVYDPGTRSFLSPDPLPNPPGAPCGANGYHYAWNDPVSLLDPSGLRPLSQADFEAIRHREELGSLGAAWESVREDPWGDVLTGLTIVAGVGLMFVPGGQVLGAGLLIGAGASLATGMATGKLNPRVVAVTALVGGVTGGVGDLLGGAAPVVQALVRGAVSAGGGVAAEAASRGPASWQSAALGFGLGGMDGVAGGISGRLGLAEEVNGAAGLASASSMTSAARLARHLASEEASSIFTESGALKPEIISSSQRIISGADLGNPRVIEELTANGSNIADWGKYATSKFESPSGPFQVHFYYNPAEDIGNWRIDYKAVFYNGIQSR